MTEPNFKVGDVVECINPIVGDMNIGDRFTITDVITEFSESGLTLRHLYSLYECDGWFGEHSFYNDTKEAFISISAYKDTKFPSSGGDDIHGNPYPKFNNRREEIMWLFYHELAHHKQMLGGNNMSWGENPTPECGNKEEKDANKYANKMYKRRR